MDDASAILQGVELEPEEASSGGQSSPRGFSNPDVLSRAQETRARNRASNTPTDLIPEENPEGATRKRGGGRPKKAERSLKGVEQLLTAIHFMIATATGFDDLKIEPEESHLLAEALANLADHYKIKLDGKSGAVMGLIYAAGSIYGPRAVTIGIKLRSAKNNNGNPVS